MDVKVPEVPLASDAAFGHVEPAVPNVTAFVARQRVGFFVLMEATSQYGTLEPELRVGERTCWAVPVVLTLPDRGSLGRVGEILVDAETGEVLADDQTVKRIRENGQRLARCASLQAGE